MNLDLWTFVTSQAGTSLFAAVSALAALGAAFGAFRSAKATRKVAEAHFLWQLLTEYSSDEMLAALRQLRNWRAEAGDAFPEKWHVALGKDDPVAQTVDRARRRVKGYFVRPVRMYKSGLVTKGMVRAACSRDGINILFDIVVPLEFVLNPKFDASEIILLQKLCGRAGSGGLINPISYVPPSQG